MKLIVAIMAISVPALAVTPALHALKKLEAHLAPEIEGEILRALPPHKLASHFVEYETQLARGKFESKRLGFSDFRGKTEALLQLGFTGIYHRVHCDVSATVESVPFAKQPVPVLEQQVNEAQLILKQHEIRCKLVK